MGWRNRRGFGAGPCTQYVRRIVNVSRTLADEEQGPHQGANHRVTEGVRLDAEDEGSLSVTLGAQGTQGPDRRGSLARPTEPKEVVFPEEGGPASFMAASSSASSTHRRSQRPSGSGLSDTR